MSQSESWQFPLALLLLWALGVFTGFLLAKGPEQWRRAIESVKRAIAAWRGDRA